MILATTFVLIACAIATEGTVFIGKIDNGEAVPVDLSLHRHWALLRSGQPRLPQPFFRQSINLYDLVKHLEARKIVQDRECYIKKFEASANQLRTLLRGIKSSKSGGSRQVSEEWNIPGEEIKEEDLEEEVGTKIAEFCQGYKVYWMKETRPVTKQHVAGIIQRQVNFPYPLPSIQIPTINPSKLSTYKPKFNPSKLYTYKPTKYLTHSGGLGYNSYTGLGPRLKIDYEKGPLSVSGHGVFGKNGRYSLGGNFYYNKGRFSAIGTGSYNRGSGFTGSVGLRYKFGG